ncbi:MAG: tetratricopeptide repeat protein [Lyngbya sp. HA4199-MV5]|nr:tetratricopeptide repeat protein [Lyngbya sp. HA4199-MV5]
MQEPSIAPLLEALKNPDEAVRDSATHALWRIWFEQKGVLGLEMIRRAQSLLEEGNPSEAEATLTALVQSQPDFAEAWNRRAVLYYVQGHYQKAIADCETVLRLNPVHFGALHGLGLCHAALSHYADAIEAFHRAIAIQPYSLANQRLLLECTMRLG